jgi:hypothetical protein
LTLFYKRDTVQTQGFRDDLRGYRKMAERAKSKSRGERTPAVVQAAGSGMIRARIAPDMKAEAESILNQIGLSPSDGIRMFFRQISDVTRSTRRHLPS